MILDVDFGYEDILENFPAFDVKQCKHPELLNFDVKDNITGQQQRSWLIYHCIKEFEQHRGEVGLDIGSGQAASPFCLSLDKAWTSYNEEYGGGEYHPQIQCKAEKLPFTDNSFWWIIAAHSLEHMDNTLGTLKEWVRVLKSGGCLYLIMPDEKFKHYPEDRTHKAHFSASEFEEEILVQIREVVKIIEYDTFANSFSFNCILKKI